MRSTNGSTEIDQSLEEDIGGNIRTLTRASEAIHRHENRNHEMLGENLSVLLRRVSEASTREIESLIDELHGLRNKLETQGERIQGDIVRYAELSQGVIQLATITSDNVKKLPPNSSDSQSTIATDVSRPGR